MDKRFLCLKKTYWKQPELYPEVAKNQMFDEGRVKQSFPEMIILARNGGSTGKGGGGGMILTGFQH